MERISPGELKWRATAPWYEIMVKDMKAMAPSNIPDVWVEAAQYQVNNATNEKVGNFKVLKWRPTNIDHDARIADEAEFWCSATVGGKSYAILARLGKDSAVEFYPGNAKEIKAPWY